MLQKPFEMEESSMERYIINRTSFGIKNISSFIKFFGRTGVDSIDFAAKKLNSKKVHFTLVIKSQRCVR